MPCGKPTGRGGPNRGQGRKPKGDVPRTERRLVRYTPAEAERLDAEAEALGVSTSELIRERSLRNDSLLGADKGAGGGGEA